MILRQYQNGYEKTTNSLECVIPTETISGRSPLERMYRIT